MLYIARQHRPDRHLGRQSDTHIVRCTKVSQVFYTCLHRQVERITRDCYFKRFV